MRVALEGGCSFLGDLLVLVYCDPLTPNGPRHLPAARQGNAAAEDDDPSVVGRLGAVEGPGWAISARSWVGTRYDTELKALLVAMSTLPSQASSMRANAFRVVLAPGY
jgi:hypothetical protein